MKDVKSNENAPSKSLQSVKSLQSISTSVISVHIKEFTDIEKLPLPKLLTRNIEDYWLTDFLYCKDSFPNQKRS